MEETMSHKITDKCVGCSICKKNCPVGAISGELKNTHIIDEDVCIDCGLCGKVCPKNAVTDGSGSFVVKTPKSEWKKPSISRNTCVGCSICVVTCPAECLEIEPARFHGDIETIAHLAQPEKCISCGLCSKACPIDAITMK